MVTVVAERHSDPHIESANESVKVSIIYADGRREVIGFTNGTPEGVAKHAATSGVPFRLS
jgi:hypothetical protein